LSELQKLILVVDDQEAIVALIVSHLMAEGYDVDKAVSGEGALKKIQERRPHLVVLDICLPGIDGIETLRRIKALDNNIPVIMATGIYDSEECRRAFEAGATDYLTKPIDFQYLKNTILTQLS